VLDFAKLVKFLDTCFTGCLVHGQIADNIYPFVFEFSDKQIQQLETITNTNIYKNDSLFFNFVDGIVELAKSSKLDKEKLQHFFNFNDTLDISRNSCLNDYIPEIEKLRKLL
jgi:hypothetical protein